ncbi:predicted protein [Chaetomium globosum CBS 148.51]|uniref:Uncharacterized protein n=1 Tax=Chaetomium globosum (strain ATCC 6205 / CBS 148.51 / DSM 1962 / NBRC 6347 / NRRL 1970) TaxID=306901 RepID=Q2GQA1_CHAGB|nr:uncharacterized protein CHGG_09853 [Chaetomium globosum CBS 148.51]EAQ83449.1 predicted protein [Chaetomium globosum CBS 148.51]
MAECSFDHYPSPVPIHHCHPAGSPTRPMDLRTDQWIRLHKMIPHSVTTTAISMRMTRTRQNPSGL